MKYNRILLKLSGESLGGEEGIGIDSETLKQYASEICSVVSSGIQVAIVIGGGNIFRGLSGVSKGFDRVKGDQMGMLATVINSLALSQSINGLGTPCKVFTSTQMFPYADYYIKESVVEFMRGGGVAIIAGGTGNPFFTTDSASALRAAELEVDALLKGTRVDGVYDKDPEKFSDAIKFSSLSYDRALSDNLKIMDMTAFTLCKENNIPIIVFDMNQKGNLSLVVEGADIGTIVGK